jgi:hypothetical protein
MKGGSPQFVSIGVLAFILLSIARGFAAELMDCPDCTKQISSRAVFCPHCGCPGEAIVKEALRRAEARRPKPLVAVTTPGTRGHCVPVEWKGNRYVVMDAALLGVLDSLSLTPLNKTEDLAYRDLELALDAPLIRFKADSDHVEFLKVAPPTVKTQDSNKYLLTDASFADDTKPNAVASLNAKGQLVALKTSSDGFVPLNAGHKWKSISPSEYRAQVKLLDKLERNKVLPVHRNELRSTAWLTQFLKSRAQSLLN